MLELKRPCTPSRLRADALNLANQNSQRQVDRAWSVLVLVARVLHDEYDLQSLATCAKLAVLHRQRQARGVQRVSGAS